MATFFHSFSNSLFISHFIIHCCVYKFLHTHTNVPIRKVCPTAVLLCCDIVSNKYLWSHNQSSDIWYSYPILTDPDAPSRANPVRREFRHWLVGNIPGDKLDQGETLTEYVGSGPPKDTGKVEYYTVSLFCWCALRWEGPPTNNV